MLLTDIHLTIDDFDRVSWEDVIRACERKECSDYSDAFYARAKEAKASEDTKAQQVWTLLHAISSLRLQPDSPDEPFAPLMLFQNIRSAILEDFTDEHLELFEKLIPTISDAELQARIADVLWIRKRDFRIAELAIDAYVESAKLLEHPEHWPPCVKRIQRAIGLAASLGRKSGSFDKVIRHAESVLDKYSGDDPLFLSATLMELLQEYHKGDRSKLAALAEKAASRAEGAHNWYLARHYWQIKARWHALAKNTENEREALVRLAESYVSEANHAIQNNERGFSVAAHHLQSAIESLRRVKGTEERRKELHKILLEYQEKSLSGMRTISAEVDTSEMVSRAIEYVKGKTLLDALLSLAGLGKSPRVADLKTQAQEMAKAAPFAHLLSDVALSDTGKVVSRTPSMLSDNPEDIEAATRAHMYRNAEIHRHLHSLGLVEPARHQIILEHDVRVADLFPIVLNNPFVPPGRERIFAQGLHTGMHGDYLTAAHLLIPQIENSIRDILNRRGVVTSGLDAKGIQNEFDLNTLLYMPELEQLIDKDTIFDLKGLLVEHSGSNLRNRMAHGLMDFDQFFSTQTIYLWWLTLWLCCIPIWDMILREQQESSDAISESS